MGTVLIHQPLSLDRPLTTASPVTMVPGPGHRQHRRPLLFTGNLYSQGVEGHVNYGNNQAGQNAVTRTFWEILSRELPLRR